MKRNCGNKKKRERIITIILLIMALCTSCGINKAEVAVDDMVETTKFSNAETSETMAVSISYRAEETTSVNQEEQTSEEKAGDTAVQNNLKSDLSYLFENGVPKPNNDFYLIENSDGRVITRAEIEGFEADKLEIAIAEIYARMGYIPEGYSLRTYFACQKWYNPSLSDMSSIVLNEYQTENIRILEEQKEWAEQADSNEEAGRERFRKLTSGTEYEIEIISTDPNEGLIKIYSGEGRGNVLIRDKGNFELQAERLQCAVIYEFVTDEGYYLLLSGNIDMYDGYEACLFEVENGECEEVSSVGGKIEYIFDDMFCICREYEFTHIYQYCWYRFINGRLVPCGEALIENTRELEDGNSILYVTPGYADENGKMVKKELVTDDRIRVISLDFRGMSDTEQTTQYWKVLVNGEEVAYIPARYVGNGYGDVYCEDGIEVYRHSDAEEFHYYSVD